MSNNLSEVLSVPIGAGSLAYAGGRFLFPTTYGDVGGFNISTNVAIGTSVGLASFANQSTKHITFPMLGVDEYDSEMITMLAGPALTGVGSIGGAVALQSISAGNLQLPPINDAVKLFALGAASEVGANYASDALVKPLISKYLD